MGKKETVKVSVSTFFLIIAIIVIAVMGYFMYKLYNDKVEETKKSADLQNQVNTLNGTVNDLQGKIDTISKYINSNGYEENVTINNTPIANEEYTKSTDSLSNYIGLWEKSNAHIYIYSINNDEIVFDYSDQSGKPIGDKTKASLNQNTASFSIKDGDNTLSGKITLKNNTIILNIVNTTFSNISEGTTIFSNYMGLQN